MTKIKSFEDIQHARTLIDKYFTIDLLTAKMPEDIEIIVSVAGKLKLKSEGYWDQEMDIVLNMLPVVRFSEKDLARLYGIKKRNS